MKREWPQEIARYTANLVTIYSEASKGDVAVGKRWYSDARKFARALARKHHVSVDIAAGVIAALSPGSEWTRNKANADEFLRVARICDSCACDRFDLTTYGARPLAKAWAIFQGAPIAQTLNGPKTVAFYRAIMGASTTDVVIDGHAKSACLGVRIGNHDGRTQDGKRLTGGVKVEAHEYRHLEHAYRAAAEVVGLAPNDFQAVIWIAWKRFPVGHVVKPLVEIAA